MQERYSADINEVAKRIACNIRRIRLLNGITMEQVAERVGITFQQVQKYEDGKNRIPLQALIAYSNVLGVSISDLLLEDDESENPMAQLGKAEASVLRSLRKITCSRRRQFVRYVAKFMEMWEVREGK